VKNNVLDSGHAASSVKADDDRPPTAPAGPVEARNGPAPSYPIESVGNALKLLLMFRSQQTIRAAEAGKALGVARSTAHRLLAMLAYYGFVTQDQVTRAYQAGPALVEVGLSVIGLMDIRSHARPYLVDLRDAVQETVHLAQLQGTDVLFLDSIESDRPVRVGSRVGQLMPAHVTSTGKALLAELSHDELVARYGRGRLPASTKRSITSLSRLERDLREIRARGYATSVGESEPDVSAVAAVIRDRLDRAVAALSVSAPITRLDPSGTAKIAEQAKQAARRVGATLA